MKASNLFYFPIAVVLGGYFLFNFWLSNNFLEYNILQQHIEKGHFGRQITDFNIYDANSFDFYIVKDSSSIVDYFRVIGITNDNQLLVNKGKDIGLFPKNMHENTFIEKHTYHLWFISFDRVMNWVPDFAKNDRNFEEEIHIYTSSELNSLICQKSVFGFTVSNMLVDTYSNEKEYGEFYILFKYYTGGTFANLLAIILILLFLITNRWAKQTLFMLNRSNLYYFLIFIVICILAWILPTTIGPSFIENIQVYSFVYAFLSFLLTYLVFQYWKKKFVIENFPKRQFWSFIMIIILGLTITLICRLLLKKIYYLSHVDNEFYENFQSSIFWTLSLSFNNLFNFATANFLNNLIVHISTLRRKSKQLKNIASHEIDTQSQNQKTEVNHQFLHESLQKIAQLSSADPELTESLTLSLSQYYRYTTNRSNDIWISIEKEMEAVKEYLNIAKIRLDGNLQYDIDVSKEVLDFEIPKFLLLTLVKTTVELSENKIYTTRMFFLNLKSNENEIQLSLCCDAEFNLSIENHYFNDIYQILNSYYPEKYTFQITDHPKNCILLTLKNERRNP